MGEVDYTNLSSCISRNFVKKKRFFFSFLKRKSAHLQFVSYNCAKFETDCSKTVGGVDYTNFFEGQTTRRIGKNAHRQSSRGHKTEIKQDDHSTVRWMDECMTCDYSPFLQYFSHVRTRGR